MLAALEDVEILEAGSSTRPWPRSKPPRRICSCSTSVSPRTRAIAAGSRCSESVRAAGRSTPAVIVTSSSELAEIREAMRHGAQDYV